MAQMDVMALLRKAFMLLGDDCRTWRVSTIPMVAQMVVDDEPSYQYDKDSRKGAVLDVTCALYDLHRGTMMGMLR
jgi:hypothetical protein